MGDERIAVRVVAVRMGVDQVVDVVRRDAGGVTQGRQHDGRQRFVEQRVDEQGLVAVAHGAGVRPAPACSGCIDA